MNNKEFVEIPLRVMTLVNERMEQFLNLEIGLFPEDKDEIGDIDADMNMSFFPANRALKPSIVKKLTQATYHQLSMHINNMEEVSERVFDHIIEDICIELIFDISTNGMSRYNEAYHFIKELEEVAQRTYETQPISTGIIILRQDNALEKQLQNLNVDYIPINGGSSIGELISKEKPLIKLVNGKSTAFVLNSNFKVIGFARKMKEYKSVEDEVMKKFNERYNNNLRAYTLEHIKNLLGKGYPTDQEIFKNMLKKKDPSREAPDMVVVKGVAKAYYKTINGLSEDLNQVIKETYLEPINNESYFIKIQNKEIQWIYDDDYILSLKNNNWEMKQYTILCSAIFEFINIEKILSSAYMPAEVLAKDIMAKLDKVIALINVIRAVSSKHIGGLFVIIKNSDGDIEDQIPKNLIRKKDETLSYKMLLSPSLSNKDVMDIQNIDNFLAESIVGTDGATILDTNLNIVSFGEIIQNSADSKEPPFGARTNAAISASKYGVAIKVSHDGEVEVYREGERIFKI